MKKYSDSLWAMLIVILLSASGTIAINYYQNIINFIKLDNSFDIDNNFPSSEAPIITPPSSKSGSIVLYKNFIMAEKISPESIRNNSYKIIAKGEIESATLHVEASPTKFGADKTRIHTVYFYIDDGETGGHLASRREGAKIVEGGFKIGDKPYILNLDLSELAVARGINEMVKIPVIQMLNDNQKHWIGAFVATGIYGSLDKLEILYTCKIDTDCSIDLAD